MTYFFDDYIGDLLFVHRLLLCVPHIVGSFVHCFLLFHVKEQTNSSIFIFEGRPVFLFRALWNKRDAHALLIADHRLILTSQELPGILQ